MRALPALHTRARLGYAGETYAERPAGSGNFNVNQGAFNENGISYDENGNITALARNAIQTGGSIVQVDNLAYNYDTANNPNRLLTVTDGTGSNYTGYGFKNLTGNTSNTYQYDANGNMTADPYKGLSTTYNILNRTDKIIITTATNRYLTYTYDATGILLRKQQYDNNTLQTTTDYTDGFVFTTAGTGSASLAYFGMPEGRIRNNGGTLKPEYIITDQQGNARISFEDNGSGTAVVRQENSYYSFGLIMPGSPVNTPTTPNKNLYNGGAEWQNDYGDLPDLQQTFYRNYDAALGRWVSVDSKAEAADNLSAYHYGRNNPIMYNDPNGDLSQAQWNFVVDQYNNGIDGNYVAVDGDGDNIHQVDETTAQYNALTGSSSYNASGGARNFVSFLINVINSQQVQISPKGLTYWTQSSDMIYNPPSIDPSATSDDYIQAEEVMITNIKTFVSWSNIQDMFQNFLNQSLSTEDDNKGLPDIAGVTIGGNVVDVAGVGVHLSLSLIIWGEDAGFYATITPSGRLGVDDGISGGYFWGHYTGDSSYPSYKDFLGSTIDLTGNAASGHYYWSSFSGVNIFNPTWEGTGYSFGGEAGLSIGIGSTISIYSQKFK